MFKWLKSWWNSLFGSENIIELGAAIPNIRVLKKPKKVEKRRDIGGLKKSVDYIYGVLAHRDYMDRQGISINVSRDIVKALRKIGVFIIPLSDDIFDGKEWINSNRYEWIENGTPALFFLSLHDDKKEDANEFFYGVKVEKKQHRHIVEWCSKNEDLYQLGYGYLAEDPPRWFKRAKGKIVWIHYFYAINKKSGKSRILKHRMEKKITIGRGVYTQVNMVHPNDSLEKDENPMRDETLSSLMNVWAQRDAHWQVEATRSGHKITTCISQNEAKYYFRKRNVDDNGKRKSILHWVKAHHRKTKKGTSNVRTHFRGNREFTWGEYSIKIRIPEMHSYMLSNVPIEVHLLENKESEKGYIKLEDATGKISGDRK